MSSSLGFEAFTPIGDLDQTLSDYNPDSELNRVASSAVGTTVTGSGDLIRVLAASQELAAATDVQHRYLGV